MSPTETQPRTSMLDIAGLAKHLGVTERFVRRLVEDNRVPYLKIGKFVRFDPNEIDRWLDTKRVQQLHPD